MFSSPCHRIIIDKESSLTVSTSLIASMPFFNNIITVIRRVFENFTYITYFGIESNLEECYLLEKQYTKVYIKCKTSFKMACPSHK